MNSPGPREHTNSLQVAITLTEGVVGVDLRGEVDLANHDQFCAGLATTELREARVVWVDLHSLTFCDVAGCRALLRLEQRARAAGHEARLLGASPTITKVMALLAKESESAA